MPDEYGYDSEEEQLTELAGGAEEAPPEPKEGEAGGGRPAAPDYERQLRVMNEKLAKVEEDRNKLYSLFENAKPDLEMVRKLKTTFSDDPSKMDKAKLSELPPELVYKYQQAADPKTRQEVGTELLSHQVREILKREREVEAAESRRNNEEYEKIRSQRLASLSSLQKSEALGDFGKWVVPRIHNFVQAIETDPAMAKRFSWLYNVPPEDFGTAAAAQILFATIASNPSQLKNWYAMQAAAEQALNRGTGRDNQAGGVNPGQRYGKGKVEGEALDKIAKEVLNTGGLDSESLIG